MFGVAPRLVKQSREGIFGGYVRPPIAPTQPASSTRSASNLGTEGGVRSWRRRAATSTLLWEQAPGRPVDQEKPEATSTSEIHGQGLPDFEYACSRPPSFSRGHFPHLRLGAHNVAGDDRAEPRGSDRMVVPEQRRYTNRVLISPVVPSFDGPNAF